VTRIIAQVGKQLKKKYSISYFKSNIYRIAGEKEKWKRKFQKQEENENKKITSQTNQP